MCLVQPGRFSWREGYGGLKIDQAKVKDYFSLAGSR